MCNFTPSAAISLETVLAVGELVQAAAHLGGVTGPVEFRVIPSSPPYAVEALGNTGMSFVPERGEADASSDGVVLSDHWCGDCGECEYCWEEEMQNCGMMPDGGCNLAGTEYCDWDCRMRELYELEDDDD